MITAARFFLSLMAFGQSADESFQRLVFECSQLEKGFAALKTKSGVKMENDKAACAGISCVRARLDRLKNGNKAAPVNPENCGKFAQAEKAAKAEDAGKQLPAIALASELQKDALACQMKAALEDLWSCTEAMAESSQTQASRNAPKLVAAGCGKNPDSCEGLKVEADRLGHELLPSLLSSLREFRQLVKQSFCKHCNL